MKHKTSILIFSFLFSLFLGCASSESADSDKVAQSQIYQQYYLTNDLSTESFKAIVFFRFGGSMGTTLRLIKPSQVTMEGQMLTLETAFLSGSFYKTVKPAFKSSKEISFTFTDYENNQFKNQFHLPIIKVEKSPAILDAGQSTEFKWEGEALRDNENVTLCIKQESTIFRLENSTPGSKSITIAQGNPGNLKNGKGLIYFERERNFPLPEAQTIGGTAKIKSISNKRGIEIKGIKVENP